MICAMVDKEGGAGFPEIHGENPPGQLPAEYKVDEVTSANGLRRAAWTRFIKAQHLLTRAIEDNLHIVAKVGPAGRVIIISSMGVAGTIGGIYLCKKLLKHRHNPRRENLDS